MCAWSALHLEVDAERRQALKFVGAVVLGWGLLPPSRSVAAAADDVAFAAGSLDDVLRALRAAPVPDAQISVKVPDAVENGAVVPVEVTSRLSGAQTIFVLSEANPFPLVVRFFIPEGTDAFIATRIKVARSCNVYALVQADGRFYSAMKATNVTVGGCGA